jgi:hypothetical protein
VALIEIANEVHSGAAALISPDGNGPPFVAKVGAVALASATHEIRFLMGELQWFAMHDRAAEDDTPLASRHRDPRCRRRIDPYAQRRHCSYLRA